MAVLAPNCVSALAQAFPAHAKLFVKDFLDECTLGHIRAQNPHHWPPDTAILQSYITLALHPVQDVCDALLTESSVAKKGRSQCTPAVPTV